MATTTVYTQDQEQALAQVLATHRTHHTDNDSWMGSNHVDAPGREWPAVVELHYWGANRTLHFAQFPGMTRATLAAGIAAAGYFAANLGGFDVYGVSTFH